MFDYSCHGSLSRRARAVPDSLPPARRGIGGARPGGAGRGRAGPALLRHPGAAAGRGAAALHRQHRTFRAVRQRAGRGQALARGGGALHGGIGAAADAGRFGLAGALRLAGRSRSPPWRRPRRGRPRRWRRGSATTASCRPPCARCFAATRMRPGSYRAAVSLWFGDSGQVRRVRLLDSTGSPERDQLLTQRLGRLKLDEAAPPGVGQPITFCDPAWAGRGHRRLSCITARARMRSARTAIPVRHARDRPHEGRRPGFVAQVAGHPL